jgi:hypothetical protein
VTAAQAADLGQAGAHAAVSPPSSISIWTGRVVGRAYLAGRSSAIEPAQTPNCSRPADAALPRSVRTGQPLRSRTASPRSPAGSLSRSMGPVAAVRAQPGRGKVKGSPKGRRQRSARPLAPARVSLPRLQAINPPTPTKSRKLRLFRQTRLPRTRTATGLQSAVG